MNPTDDRIREALTALRQAPIPAIPAVTPGRPERRPTAIAWATAAAMAAALVGILWLAPSRPKEGSAALADRLTGLEARVARIEDEELRALMGREIELLRRELKLAMKSGNDAPTHP